MSVFCLFFYFLNYSQNSPVGTTKAYTASKQPVRNNGFPVFHNTGNHDRDVTRYEADKREWIAKNPEQYQAMQKTNSNKTKISRKELNTLPEERQKFILNHPELYIIE